MLHAFIAVLEELLEFVLSGFTIPNNKNKSTDAVFGVADGEGVQVYSTIQEPQRLLSGQKAYVSENDVVAHVRPVIAFDTVIGRLEYGEEVSVMRTEGKYVFVDSSLGEVWVEKNCLEYHEYDIFPRFIHATFYFSDMTETKKIRNYLQDETSGGALHMSLQAIEYVLYILKRRRIKIDWGSERPRLPGTWQKMLKGKRGVYVGLEPKTGSVIEYFTSEQQGILGVVDSVRPDNSIVVSSVGKTADGEFRNETLSVEEWKELRPVFINFT